MNACPKSPQRLQTPAEKSEHDRAKRAAHKRNEFIRQLAVFLAENQGGKSILLQMESGWGPDDPRPRLAVAWAELFHLANVDTAISIEDAATHLQAFLSPSPFEVQCALSYVLNRISNNAEVQNLIGCGTETYERLTEAYSLVTGESLDEVREEFIPGSASIHRRNT